MAKVRLIKHTKVLCKVLSSVLLISSVYAASSTYDFAGASSDTDRTAFYADTNWLSITAPDLSGQTDFPSAAYTQIASSDSTHYVSTATALYAMHHFKFIIAEATDTISGISLEWTGKGNDYNSGNQFCKLSLWDFQMAERIIVDEDTGVSAQVTLSSAITSGYLSYIDTMTKRLDVIVVGGQYSDPNEGAVWTDHMKVVVTHTGDIIPPAAISNLTALVGLNAGEIDLRWTAPGDDDMGGGSAAAYEVKYATKYIGTADYYASWVSTYAQSWTPAAPGSQETPILSGFSEGLTYWFAVKAKDEANNWSSWTSSGTVSWVNTANSNYAKTSSPVGGTFSGDFSQVGGAVYDSGSSGGDEGYGIAVDTISGGGPYVYVVGKSSHNGNFDFLTIKYNSNGEKISAVLFGQSYDDIANGVALDADGNIFVTGALSDGANNDFLTIKYDPNLNIISSATYSGGVNNVAKGIAVMPGGNVVVTGYVYNGTDDDFFTIKYDNSLNAISSTTYNGGNADVAAEVAVDDAGNIYVTGDSHNGTDNDYCTIKYNSALSGFISSNTYNGGGTDKALGIDIDGAGNVFVTGEKFNGSNYDYMTIKYNGGLGVISSVTFDSGGTDIAKSVAVDEAGNVFVAGSSLDKYCTIKYGADLAFISSVTYSGTFDSAYAVAVGTSHYVYVTGASEIGSPNMDFRTIRYYLGAGDTVPPTIAISSPEAGSFVNILTQVNGTADDAGSISTVTLRIIRSSDNYEWDYTYWSDGAVEKWNGVNNLYTSSWTLTSLPSWVDGSSYTLVAKARDGVGNWSAVYSTVTFTYDNLEPNSSIAVPVNGNNYSSLTNISGTSWDTFIGNYSGIDKVEISVRDLKFGATYWNGSAWQDSESWQVSSGSQPYSYGFSDSNWTDGHEYQIKSRASDNAGNVETSIEISSFTFDSSVPTVGVTEPVEGSYLNSLTEIAGTADDNIEVSTVTVKIQRLSDNWFWSPGPQWAVGETWNGVNDLYTSTWTLTTLPGWVDSSSYTVIAKAKDGAGNWSTVYSTNTFTYDITAPVSVTTAPANGKTLATLTHIGGTAMDALSGVTVVKVNICDLTEGATYWNGSGWGETSYWLNVSFAAPDWSYSFLDGDWTEGHVYKIQSQAADDAVNIESAVNESTFTFSKTGAELQILLPGETATPGIAPGKTGTPTAQTAGIAFSVTVNGVDDLWNIASNASAIVQLASSDPNDTEPSNISLANGTTFFSITLVTAGTATLTATDTDGTALAPDASSEVSVNPNVPAKLQVLVPGETSAAGTGSGKTGAPDVQYAGAAFTITVNACDAYWNVVSTDPTVNVTTGDNDDTDPGNISLLAGTKNVEITLITPSTGTTISASATGYTAGVSTYVVVSSTDVVPPTVGITEPAAAYTNSVMKIAGTANDNVAVSSVTLWIEREDTFVWDGGTWTGAGVWIPADNVYVSSWSYTTAVQWDDGISYDIIVKAKDSNDNWSTVYDTVTFTYDISLPTSTVTYPVESGQYTDITSITGTSTDTVSGVWATKIKIFALSGPYTGAWWQDGSGWQGAEFWNDASGTDSWSFDTSMIGWSTGTYNVQPKVQDLAGNWEVPLSSVTFAILPSTPASPAGFNGAAQTAGSINWSWTDGANEEGYKITTATGGMITVLPADTTFYMEMSLSVNTSYQRYVEAYNAGGSSVAAGVSVYTLAYPPLTTAVISSSTGSVSITWQDNSNPAGTRWGIERSTHSDFFETWVISTFISNYTAIGYTDTGLDDGTTYYYRVRAYNGDAVVTAFDSVVSTMTAIAPDVTAPSAVSDFAAVSGVNDGEIDLSWTAPGDDGVSDTLEGFYRIDYATSVKAWDYTDYKIEFVATASPPGTSLNWTVSGLTGGTTYSFVMWSADEVPNWSAVSNNTSSLAQIVVSTPAAPTVFSGAAQDSVSIMWSWTDNSDNEDGFCLKNSSDVIVSTITANTTFYLETGLGVNTQNYRYLASYNGAGETPSIPAAIYTLANPPASFSVTTSSFAAALSWTANGNPAATDYEIEWSTAADFSVPDYDTTTDVSYLIAPLVSDTTYYIRMSAVNGDGYSTAFSETEVFTVEPDVTAPAAVTAFAAETVNVKGAVKLSWTNPGNDGTVGTIVGGAQIIRYVTGAVTTVMPDIIKDMVPGTTEELTVTGLVPGGSYTFYIKVKDESGNVSAEVSAGVSAGAQPVLDVYSITSPITAGVSSDFTVKAKNALGETDTGYTGTITFESKIMDGTYMGANAMAAVPADYSFTSSDNGLHVFMGGAVFMDKGELYSCYVKATDTGDSLITGQQTVTVSPLDFISGVVTQKDGTPLTGVYVEAYGTGLSTGVPFTTINGSYTVLGLDSGTYTVRVTWTDSGGFESSAEKQTMNGQAEFNFTLGVNYDLVVVQGLLAGLSVSRICSAASVIMPQETPEYAFVEISAGRKIMKVPVAADGSFRIGNIIPGRYSIKAWDGSRYSNSENIILSGGAQVTVNFTFPSTVDVYCWPNPFVELKTNEAGVHIRYIGGSYAANLKIYTITGELVRETGEFSLFTRAEDGLAGYEFIWDLRNNSRQDVASGVYFYILELDGVSGGVKEYKGKIVVVR